MATRSFRNVRVALIATTAIAAALPAATVNAQFFRDDFEDGSATDGNPVTWNADPPFVGGTRVVQDGSYILTPDGIDDFPDVGFSATEIDVVAEGRSFGQVSVSSTVRLLASEPGFFIGLNGRSTLNEAGEQNAGLWGAVRNSGRLEIGAFNVKDNKDQRWVGSYGPISSSLVTTDVNLQLDIFADSAALTAWEVGTPRPLQPQIVVPDLPDFVPSTGRVGMWTGQGLAPPLSAVAFRYFEAAPVPEPSSLVLAGVAAVAALHRARRRRVR